MDRADQRYLDDALAGAERQTHQARPVYGHDLVADVESAGFLGRPAVHHAGDDDGGQDGPPARLYDHHAQDLAFLLLDVHLQGRRRTNRTGLSQTRASAAARRILPPHVVTNPGRLKN